MSDRYICEVKITKVEYAGDHDRETIVVATTREAEYPGRALTTAYEQADNMLSEAQS